jgi:hypothetical protein
LLLDNLALQQEREKFEREQNLKSSQRQVDQVRNNVVVRKIQMLFKQTVKDLSRDELEEFEKVYLIVDKDLELRRERDGNIEFKESAEKVWEKKGQGEVKKVIDSTSLLCFLDDSNSLKRLEM